MTESRSATAIVAVCLIAMAALCAAADEQAQPPTGQAGAPPQEETQPPAGQPGVAAEGAAQPSAGQPGATAPSRESTAQQITPVQVPAHPVFYPSQRQLNAWLDAGYNAFATGEAHDDVFSIWGVDRWFWLPEQVIPVGADAALVGLSCETPQLLATHAAWRGTRSALPETRITQAVYSQLAEQAGYCRFLVVGLTKLPGQSLGLEYVLRVNGLRYGEPIVSSFYGGAFTVPSDSIDSRGYAYVSVEFVERFQIDYAVEVKGTTYDRVKIRSSLGYERKTSALVIQPRQPTPCRYLISETVDFPLLRYDGAPVIPADASEITLEVLAPSASYEVSVSLTKDDSYLRDEPPMMNPMAAVTMPVGPVPRGLPPRPKTKIALRLEELTKAPEFAGAVGRVWQPDEKVPLLYASFEPGTPGSKMRSLMRAMVLAAQPLVESGEIRLVAAVRGRNVIEGRYNSLSKRVVFSQLP